MWPTALIQWWIFMEWLLMADTDILGTNRADKLVLGDDAYDFSALSGNIKIVGGNGNNHISAGDGNSSLSLGDGPAFVDLKDGKNSITIGEGDISIQTGNGDTGTATVNLTVTGEGRRP